MGDLYKETGVKTLRLYLCTEIVQHECAHNNPGSSVKSVKLQPSLQHIETVGTKQDSAIIDETNHSEDVSCKKIRLDKIDMDVSEQPIETITVEDNKLPDIPHASTAPIVDLTDTDFPDLLGTDILGQAMMQLQDYQEDIQFENTVTFSPTASSCPFASTENIPQLRIKVHRGQVMRELIDFIKNTDCHNFRADIVTVTMVLPNGQEEAGEDTGGVFRDMMSEFYDDFYSQLTTGNNLKVPSLHAKMGREEWEAIGKIIQLGYIQQRMLPIRLAPSFLHFSLMSAEINKMDLLEEYIKFLPESEAEIVSKALLSYDEADSDDLLDFFDDHHHTSLPCKETFRMKVAELAHKELIQEPSYAAKTWHR